MTVRFIIAPKQLNHSSFIFNKTSNYNFFPLLPNHKEEYTYIGRDKKAGIGMMYCITKVGRCSRKCGWKDY